MKRLTLPLVTLAMLFTGISAQAASDHTYASKKNGGPYPTFDCSLANPCSSLQDAINQANSPGIVTITDGEFDEAITIAHTVSLQAYEGVGIILRPPASGTAITINAGTSDKVNIVGLEITGLSTGSTGILFNSGLGLFMRNVTLSGFTDVAINFAPNTSPAGGVPAQLGMKDSVIAQNTNGNVLIKPSNSVLASVNFKRVTIRNSVYGIRADDSAGSGLIKVDVTDLGAFNHSNNGFLAVGTGTGPVHFMIDRCAAQNNGTYGAVATGSNAFMILSNSTIVSNATGVAQLSGSTVAMPGNNVVNFNTTNITGTITSISLH